MGALAHYPEFALKPVNKKKKAAVKGSPDLKMFISAAQVIAGGDGGHCAI